MGKGINKVIRRGCVFFSVFIAASLCYAQDYMQAKGAIHIQSRVSDGLYRPERIIQKARESGIQVIVFTDTLLRRWEYGIWPLRNIIKKRIEEESVLRFGIENYLRKINQLQDTYSDLVILPGVEVSPFYFWQGNFFKKDLQLHNWHQKLIVIGLDKEAYRNLPVVTNYSHLPKDKRDFLRLWPLITVALGIFLLTFYFKTGYLSYKNFGVIIIGLSVVFLINNMFFPLSNYDQYHGNQGIKPYQELIDYVIQRGGLVFWPHPEASYLRKVDGIDVYTPGYSHDLFAAKDYTGFAALYLANITFIDPDKGWDKILNQYCKNQRKNPAWGIGEIGYHGLSKKIGTVQTIILIEALEKKEVLKSLKRGRMYAKLFFKKNDFSLDRFIVTDTQSGRQAFMGDEITCKTLPTLSISASCSTYPEERVNIQLIRSGKVIKNFQMPASNFEIEFKDNYFENAEKIYYRLIITSSHSKIVSNPIFVQFSK